MERLLFIGLRVVCRIRNLVAEVRLLATQLGVVIMDSDKA
jgi:hypothetical protein